MPASHCCIAASWSLATSNRHSAITIWFARALSIAPRFPPLGLVRRPPFAGVRGTIGAPARAGILQRLTTAVIGERPLPEIQLIPAR